MVKKVDKIEKELEKFEKTIEKLEFKVEELKKDSISKSYLFKMLTGFAIGISILTGVGTEVSLLDDFQAQDSKITRVIKNSLGSGSKPNKIEDDLS